jgi:hypothetical protein
MAIQPIDLQTLFAQMDKVGKTQSAQREGVGMHQDLQGVQLQRKTEEHIQSVNEAQNTGEGTEKVKDRGAKGQDANTDEEKKKNAKQNTPEEEQKPAIVFSDPYLGKNIDISY